MAKLCKGIPRLGKVVGFIRLIINNAAMPSVHASKETASIVAQTNVSIVLLKLKSSTVEKTATTFSNLVVEFGGGIAGKMPIVDLFFLYGKVRRCGIF